MLGKNKQKNEKIKKSESKKKSELTKKGKKPNQREKNRFCGDDQLLDCTRRRLITTQRLYHHVNIVRRQFGKKKISLCAPST